MVPFGRLIISLVARTAGFRAVLHPDISPVVLTRRRGLQLLDTLGHDRTNAIFLCTLMYLIEDSGHRPGSSAVVALSCHCFQLAFRLGFL